MWTRNIRQVLAVSPRVNDVGIGRLSQVEPVVLGDRATWCITNAKGDLVLKTGFPTRAAALAWEKEHLAELLAANR